MKKLRKQTEDMFSVSFGMAGSSVALGAIGGNVAGFGSSALQNTSKYLPVSGTIAGVSMPMRMVQDMGKKRKRK